jgi:chemotaxis protein methyltransferase CheR
VTSAIGQRELEQFRALVTDRLGLSFDDSKLGLLAETLRRRVEEGSDSGQLYLRRLGSQHCPPEELRRLAEALTVTETYFYRNAEQIGAFVEAAIPQRLTSHTDRPAVRILSAGCASGEEPYSLAIALREQFADAAAMVSIVGVDVNPATLEKARRATYTSWTLRELPGALRGRWFRADGGVFSLDPTIRRAVTFEERNLVHDDPELWEPQSWDVVFCRNVLMYFDPMLAQAVVARIARSLTPGGYLFLGHAETLRGLSSDFHLCHTHGTFYYRRKEGVSQPETVVSARRPTVWSAQPEFAAMDTTWVEAVQSAAERIRTLAKGSQELSLQPSRAVPSGRPVPDLHRTIELLHSERFGQALEQLDALPAEQAREPEVLLLRAVTLAHSGSLEQAETVCRELLKRDELNAGGYYVLALCREGRGDVRGALEEDQVAVYLDPSFAMARLHMGLLARRQADRARARRELSQALTLLRQEDGSRLLLFGGGFSRDALAALCRAELAACGEHS